MKTKHTKIDRSAAKWLPGAMALAASTASSQAATVQITLTGNKISTTAGDQLNADLTGDGTDDVWSNRAGIGARSVYVFVSDSGVGAWLVASNGGNNFVGVAVFAPGGVGAGGIHSGPSIGSATYLNPITFTDSRINGGSPTEGWLQVNAFNTSGTNHTVELTRLIFDDANTTRPSFTSIPGVQSEWVAAVPEPGSNLALLALGAGGLTLRRRLKRAA